MVLHCWAVTSHVVALNLAPELLQHAQQVCAALGVSLQALPGETGWCREAQRPVSLLLVGAHSQAAHWVDELRLHGDLCDTPCLCVMDTIDPAVVAALRRAGVRRILFNAEFLMDAHHLLKAA